MNCRNNGVSLFTLLDEIHSLIRIRNESNSSINEMIANFAGLPSRTRTRKTNISSPRNEHSLLDIIRMERRSMGNSYAELFEDSVDLDTEYDYGDVSLEGVQWNQFHLIK